ncbi:hypothetical protein GCM10009000_024030 [Halobacterium noricense]
MLPRRISRDGSAVGARVAPAFKSPVTVRSGMRDEAEIREQYEYLAEQLDSEEMRHEGVRELFTHYKRALGWVLEEEHM